jgi:hypothetical protein
VIADISRQHGHPLHRHPAHGDGPPVLASGQPIEVPATAEHHPAVGALLADEQVVGLGVGFVAVDVGGVVQ